MINEPGEGSLTRPPSKSKREKDQVEEEDVYPGSSAHCVDIGQNAYSCSIESGDVALSSTDVSELVTSRIGRKRYRAESMASQTSSTSTVSREAEESALISDSPCIRARRAQSLRKASISSQDKWSYTTPVVTRSAKKSRNQIPPPPQRASTEKKRFSSIDASSRRKLDFDSVAEVDDDDVKNGDRDEQQDAPNTKSANPSGRAPTRKRISSMDSVGIAVVSAAAPVEALTPSPNKQVRVTPHSDSTAQLVNEELMTRHLD